MEACLPGDPGVLEFDPALRRIVLGAFRKMEGAGVHIGVDQQTRTRIQPALALLRRAAQKRSEEHTSDSVTQRSRMPSSA